MGAHMQGIRFEDADAYERGMAPWSRLAGETFLEWLAPAAGLRWLDVGCGTGTFAALIAERCAPAEVQGVDPSEALLAIARRRGSARGAAFGGVTRWRCRSGDSNSMPPSWHSSSSSYPTRRRGRLKCAG